MSATDPLGLPPAFAMGDRAVDDVRRVRRPHAVRVRLLGQLDPAAVEVPGLVVTERAGEQAGPGQHLEPVADAEQRPAGGDELAQRLAQPAAFGVSA